MTQEELNLILKKHKLWLEGKDGGERADLYKADLSHLNLIGVNLSEAYLSEVILREANLEGADLREAYLSVSDLSAAKLNYADLTKATLNAVNLLGARLHGTNLMEADLYGANFIGAILSDSDLSQANINRAIGNNKEIKTFQSDIYWVNITKDTIQIGCKNYTYEEWFNFSDKEIIEMDGKRALHWWRTWKPILKRIIKAEFKEYK